MISTRYMPAVSVLLALSLIPTVIHTYAGAGTPRSDGLSTAVIPMELAGRAGTPSSRDSQWGQRRLDAFDWFERRYSGPEDARLFVGRSLDAKQLYHHPEIEIAYGERLGRPTLQTLPGRPEIPVHVLRQQGSESRLVALYALHYDGRYVGNPIFFQLRNSLELLFSHRKPMTIFFVRQQLPTADAPIETSLAVRLLEEAIDAFRARQPRVPAAVR